MKLLDNYALDSIASEILPNSSDLFIDLRLEAYSCKMISNDKREWKKSMKCPGATEPETLLPLSSPPPETLTLSVSPKNGGRLRHSSEFSNSGGSDNEEYQSQVVGAITHRTLFDMCTLLSLSYQDYDFQQTRSSSFTIINLEECIQNVDQKFIAIVNKYGTLRERMWAAVDEAIKLSECTVYSYITDYNDKNPFTEDGCMWSFNYLFYNKQLRRFFLFACRTFAIPSLTEELTFAEN